MDGQDGQDAGLRDTCMHGCVYCYANAGREAAGRNHKRHDPSWDMLMRYDDAHAGEHSKSATLELRF